MLDKLGKSVILSALVAMIIYIGLISANGYTDIVSACLRMGFGGFALVLGLSLVNYFVRFARWHWYIHHLGHSVPILRNLAYYLAGFALTTTPGKAGEVVRSTYLKRHAVSYTHSLAAFFAERVSDLLGIVLLAGLAGTYFEGYKAVVTLFALILLATLIFVQKPAAIELVYRILRTIRSQKFQALVSNLFALIRASSSLLESRILVGGFLMSVLAWGAEGVGFYLIVRSLDIETSLWISVGIYSISTLAGAVSFIPGGLGSTEAIMGLLLVHEGASASEAVAATVLCRVATLWFAVAIGLLVMFWIGLSGKRSL